MKVGLIARSEERGLGIQTKAFYDWVNPDRTMVVTPTRLPSNHTFEGNPDWYPGATFVEFDGKQLPEEACRDWLDGLDVVFTAETFYDWRFVDWANEAAVATVCQVNPEFYRHGRDASLPHPTVWWAPTTWRTEHLPDNTVVVPVPIEPRPVVSPTFEGGRLRILHVVGRRAAQDRNGTGELMRAVLRTNRTVDLTIRIQEGELPNVPRAPNVNLYVERGSVTDRWEMYERHHILVVPRRFGGLCLPAQEAAMCGLAVAMTNVAPNNTFYPIIPIPVGPPDMFAAPCGQIELHSPHRIFFRNMIGKLLETPDRVSAAQAASREWAEKMAWPVMLPEYRQRLEEAADIVNTRRGTLLGGRRTKGNR